MTPILIRKIDYFIYLVFGTAGIIMSLFVFGFVPETMGKSNEDMNALFGTAYTKAATHEEDELDRLEMAKK